MIFSSFGLPNALQSDNATNFSSNLLKELCERLQITREGHPPYNPWSNITERYHQDLGKQLRAMLHNRGKEEWSDLLPFIAMAANSTVHELLNLSPFFLMFGRRATIPLDLVHPAKLMPTREEENVAFPTKAAAYATKLIDKMAKAFEIVKDGWKRDIEQRTKAYSNTPPDEFTIGKKVLVFTPSRKKHTSDKIQVPWHGPFVISEKLSNILYKVKALPGGDKPPAGIISLSRMKIFNEEPTEKGSDNNTPHESHENPEEQNSEEDPYFPHEYEVLHSARDTTMQEEND